MSKPPTVRWQSFINSDIDESLSAAVFSALAAQKVISEKGVVSPSFGLHTDLGFLFPHISDADERAMLTGAVRSTLLHAPCVVQLTFNHLLNAKSASLANSYTLAPDAPVISAAPQEGKHVVEITADLKRRLNVKYGLLRWYGEQQLLILGACLYRSLTNGWLIANLFSFPVVSQ